MRSIQKITVGEIQRPFAFEWDAADTASETSLIISYVKRFGPSGSAPVLLKAPFCSDQLGTTFLIPYGVWLPEEILHHLYVDDGFAPSLLKEVQAHDGLDNGNKHSVEEINPTTAFGISVTLEEFFKRRAESGKQRHYFVSDGNLITGIVGCDNFVNGNGGFFLLSHILKFEASVLRVLSLLPECFSLLTTGRKAKSLETWDRKFADSRSKSDVESLYDELRKISKSPDGQAFAALLAQTTFIDKGLLVAKLGLLSPWDKKRVERFFRHAESWRNKLAHPTTIWLRWDQSFNALSELINDIQWAMETLGGLEKKLGDSYKLVTP